jgi:hypothetical protein
MVMVRAAGGRRRKRRLFSAQSAGADDSPTGYVQGVWLLGGADSATPHGGNHHRPEHRPGDNGHHGSSHDSAGSHASHGGGDASDGGGSD